MSFSGAIHKVISQSSLGNFDQWTIKSEDSMESLISNFTKLLPAELVDVVRLRPEAIIFNNAFEGEKYKTQIEIQNISKKMITLSLRQPHASSFSVKDPGVKITLAAGLSVVRSIHYQCKFQGPLWTQIPIRINDFQFNIPVTVRKGNFCLSVTPDSLNFGKINVFSPPKTEWITVKNSGVCPVRICVDIASTGIDVIAIPNKARLRGLDSQKIQIRLLPLEPGSFLSEFWVKAGTQAHRILLQVEILEPHLVCHHPNTTGDFTLLNFPSTFPGAMRYETVVVTNQSADPATFIVLAEIQSEVFDLNMAKKKNINYEMFSISPSEGRIESFEGKIFTAVFKPIKEKQKCNWKSINQPTEKDYLCFLRIIIVKVGNVGGDCTTDSGRISEEDCCNIHNKSQPCCEEECRKKRGEGDKSSFSSVPIINNISHQLLPNVNATEGLRLCLHGLCINPVMAIIPDSLDLLEARVNQEEVRVLTLANKSSIQFGFCYVKVCYIDVIPSKEYINPGKSLEVTVKINIQSLGKYEKWFHFELFSNNNMTDEEGIITIGKASVKIVANVKTIQTLPVPKINTGITPEVTHEVGFLADEVTFSSDVKKPRNAIVPVGGKLPKIYSKSAIIAFPNDMPSTIWSSQYSKKVTRTLFTGIKRYKNPVDSTLTYTEEEKLLRKMHKDTVTQQMREIAKKLQKKEVKPKILDYELSCKQLYQMKNFKPSPMLPLELPFKADTVGQTIFPLTPLQLYNIKVKPRELNFNQVAVNNDCEELVWVENLNNFHVNLRILPGHSGLHIKGSERMKVEPRGKGAFTVVLHTDTLGKYYGSFKYVINENHKFEMTVSGEIVKKLLKLEPQELILTEPKDNVFYSWCKHVKLSNPLKSSTGFEWLIPDNCKCFKVQPMKGNVPSLSEMFCNVYYLPTFDVDFTARLSLKIESGMILVLKCSVHFKKPDIYFINPLLNVGSIPVKLTTIFKTTLFNGSYHEVPFEVIKDQMNINDLVISPTYGFIKPRGCVIISLIFNVLLIGSFDKIFTVEAYEASTALRVTGQVVFPEITLSPREFHLQRVRCYSYVTHSLVAENNSMSIVKLSFLMDKYIQFKVSLSPKYWEKEKKNDGLIIKPGESQKLYLHFFPQELASYEFYLPIKINDLIGPPLIGAVHTLKPLPYLESSDNKQQKNIMLEISEQIPCVLLEATVAPTKILFNKTDFQFNKAKGGRTEDELTFKNPQKYPLVFSLGLMKSSSPFNLFKKSTFEVLNKEKKYTIQLLPKESLTFVVKFETDTYGKFEDVLPISLRSSIENSSYTKQHPYNYIRFNGEYLKPIMYCSSRLVFYPPVPLQVEAVRSLYITACDYEEDDEVIIQNFKMDNDDQMETLSFYFVDGNHIKSGKKCILHFTLTFISSDVISFSKKIILQDKRNRTSSFTVIATADNCILTTHSFVSTIHCNINRVKFVNTEVIDVESLDHKGTVINYQTTVPISSNSDVSSSSTNTSEVTSISLSLLMKQNTPTRYVYLFSFADIGESFSHNKTVCESVERFLYEQVFSCSYFWEIGTNIKWSNAYNPAMQGAAAKNATSIRSLLEILERLYGKDIRVKFGNRNITLPKDEVARVTKIYSILQMVISFLKSQGACMSHIEPKYLLDYEDYLISLKHDIAPPDIFYNCEMEERSTSSFGEINTQLNQNVFEIVKNQCWLDLMLQIYKTLFLNSLPLSTRNAYFSDDNNKKQSLGKRQSSVFKKKMSQKLQVSEGFKEKVNHKIYGRSEISILAWLNDHYNRTRTILWEPTNCPESKIINNFVDCLEDCLVFAAVTAAYCPFIANVFFNEMYTYPKTPEEKYHNAICVTRAWDAVRIGFTVYPDDFIKPESVLMLMISAHLYKVLPSYLPEQVIKFSTSLTTETVYSIPVVNNSSSKTIYTVHIMGDSYQFFSIDNFIPVIQLKPKEKYFINVKFSARKTTIVTAILLMCGFCISPYFGVNHVYTLEGSAADLQISSVFNLTTPLNILTNISLPIVCPYQLAGEEEVFEISYGEKKPTTENLESIIWSEVCARKAPRRLFLMEGKITFSETGGTSFINIKVVCFTPKSRTFWLTFSNKKIGDFIVQITVKSKVKEIKKTILLNHIVREKEWCTCSILKLSETSVKTSKLSSQSIDKKTTCVFPSSPCPFKTKIDIPSRNADLWSAVRTMFELTLDPDEKEFWSSHFETNIGLKLLKWIIGEEVDSVTEEINYIFQNSVKYTVSCASAYVTVPQILLIPDVRLCGSVELPIHISSSAPENFVTKLTLTAEHKREIRIYKLKYLKSVVNS